jgi:serine/threonine protein kinase
MDYQPARNSYRHKQRIKARHLARRSSDDFCQTHGHSALDSVAPFESEEIILGRRLGSGTFSVVYEIQHIKLRPDQSDIYTSEQVNKREATAKSINRGAKFVIKCLKEEVEESDDDNVFLDAAQDIMHEAEMLAALSHPNIITLHGIIACRHDAFLGGSSAFFIILERLESTLGVKIDTWAKQKNSFNPSRHLKSLSSSLSSSSRAVDRIEKTTRSGSTDGGGGSFDNRLQVSKSLADAMEYLHSEGVIFRDLKPHNVGFDKEGNVKLFDFGLSRFMPQNSDGYDEVFEMSGAGTPRYTSPEVIFSESYNLKADVYTFSVILWEIMCLKQPFAKYKRRDEFDKAILRGETLHISRKWPLPIQDTIRRSLSRDLSERPTMSEICSALNDCISKGIDDSEIDGSTSTAPTSTCSLRKSLNLPSKLSSKRFFRKGSVSWGSATTTTEDTAFEELLEEVQSQVKLGA